MATEEKKKLNKTRVSNANPDNLTATEAPPIDFLEPEEWYVGRFMEAESKTGQYGSYFILKFKILTGQTESGKDAKGTIARKMVDGNLSPGKPLWDCMTVMLGREPKIGEKGLSLTAHYGKKFRCFIKDQKKKKGDTSNKRYQTIDVIKAVKKAKPA